MTKEELLAKAKKRYTPGTVVECLHLYNLITIKGSDIFTYDSDDCIRWHGDSCACVYDSNFNGGGEKWADVDIYKKVDELDQKIMDMELRLTQKK